MPVEQGLSKENTTPLSTLAIFLKTEGYQRFEALDDKTQKTFQDRFPSEGATFTSAIRTNQDGREQRLLLAILPFSETLAYVLIHEPREVGTDTNQSDQKSVELKDILFVDIQTKKTFSLRSEVDSDVLIFINTQLRFTSTGGSSIELASVGQTKPPLEPISRAMWNVYKKIEPLNILHEARHTQQLDSDIEIDSGAISERDAWAFALTKARELKQQGINLLGDLRSEEILSRVELGLISYDLSSLLNGPDARPYSRKIAEQLKGKHSHFRYFKAIVSTLFKGIRNDPSLVIDSVLYKGKKKLPKITLTDLL